MNFVNWVTSDKYNYLKKKLFFEKKICVFFIQVEFVTDIFYFLEMFSMKYFTQKLKYFFNSGFQMYFPRVFIFSISLWIFTQLSKGKMDDISKLENELRICFINRSLHNATHSHVVAQYYDMIKLLMCTSDIPRQETKRFFFLYDSSKWKALTNIVLTERRQDFSKQRWY